MTIKYRIWVLTLFPKFYTPFKETGIIGRAFQYKSGGSFQLITVSLADYSPKHFKGVDDTLYGGGHGMVIRADVLKKALLEGVIKAGGYSQNWRKELRVVYPSPKGVVWNFHTARKFAQDHWVNSSLDLVFICGRYEGIDQRFIDKYVDLKISLGDFVLSCGDIAVLGLLDSALRFVPGILGNKNAPQEDSFENGGLLEEPLYTKPQEFEGISIPPVLLSGNHKAIQDYRQKERFRVTKEHRPELYQHYFEKKGT